MFRFILIVLALGVYGCTTYGGSNPYTETGAICDNAGIESQLSSFHDKSADMQTALGVGIGGVNTTGAGAASYGSSTNNIQRAYVVRNKLQAFDAELDVVGRNIIASCKNHTRCMEMNRYKEGRCRSALDRWEDSEARFTQMTREFREIEAETVRLIAALKRPVVVKKSRHHDDDYKVNRCECTSYVGGVLANCCYDENNKRANPHNKP